MAMAMDTAMDTAMVMAMVTVWKMKKKRRASGNAYSEKKLQFRLLLRD